MDTSEGGSASAPARRPPPVSFQVALPQARPQLPPNAVTFQPRCYCCDEEYGSGDGAACSALQMLASLDDDLLHRDAQIREAVEDGDVDVAALHRAARWHMYRTFVAAMYGYLGQGVRVRISHCVIAAIRCRYRAPQCDCAPNDIATCAVHGYVGHREA